MNLKIINQGEEGTCKKGKGESIVDITWGRGGAEEEIRKWKVVGCETLSDHELIQFMIGKGDKRKDRNTCVGNRWAIKKMNREELLEVIAGNTWGTEKRGEERAIEEERNEREEEIGIDKKAEELRRIMIRACDAAMPKVRNRKRKGVFWWSEKLDTLRKEVSEQRRAIKRNNRRKGNRTDKKEAEHEVKVLSYRLTKGLYEREIGRAKAKGWKELIDTLNQDLWGRPYRTVRQKMKTNKEGPILERIDPGLVKQMVDKLFPRDEEGEEEEEEIEEEKERDHLKKHTDEDEGKIQAQEREDKEDRRRVEEITEEEMQEAIKGIKNKKAPGINGIPEEAWKVALQDRDFRERYRRLLNRCIKEGRMPGYWKAARFVLLLKPGKKEEDSPASYRPICLLEEEGKMFERVIINRMKKGMKEKGKELANRQFGFREEKSTNNAIEELKEIIEDKIEEDGIACMITIDITNAFNTIPWKWIRKGIKEHEIDKEIEGIVIEYFKERYIEYRDRNGTKEMKKLEKGVSQGSVMGPTLWNLAYDRVLKTAVPLETEVICYADDTVIVVGGEEREEVVGRANLAVSCVLKRIKEMEIAVAPEKSKVMVFTRKGMKIEEERMGIRVENKTIKIGQTIKYLGLYIDKEWDFVKHFELIVGKMKGAANELCKLLPNIGGPGEIARKLYAGVIHATGLYGAPIWWETVLRNGKIKKRIHSVQKRMAIRLVRAYRTVAKKAVTLMAGIPPFELIAEMHARMYQITEELKKRGINRKGRIIARIREQERNRMREVWKKELREKDMESGKRICEAIIPIMEEWLDRKEKGLTYHMTQIISGHGCFNVYLKRIGKEESATCSYCMDGEDDAQHTLEICTHWNEEREELKRTLGSGDLRIDNIMKQIVRDQRKWDEFRDFCGKVMRRKEEDEKIRRKEKEGDSNSDGEETEEGNTTEDGIGRKIREIKKRLRKMKKRKKRRWKIPAHLQE